VKWITSGDSPFDFTGADGVDDDPSTPHEIKDGNI
jgi:hypothetical protein